jgi:integrase
MKIDQIRLLGDGQVLWDKGDRASVKGLHVRCRGGRKTFFLYYRTRGGIQRKPKIGDFGDISLADARRAAKELLDSVITGNDPVAEWKKSKDGETINELFQKTYDDHWDEERFHNSGWAGQVKGIHRRYIEKQLGKKKVVDVTSEHLTLWKESLKHSPTSANRALAVLSTMFSYAELLKWRPQGTNPCQLIKRYKERKRKRYATEAELHGVFRILDEEADKRPAAVAFIYMLIFSGSRPRAIERATWDQLTPFEREGKRYGVLTFHGKTTEETGEEEMVILPPQAMAVIDCLPRIKGRTITGMKIPRRLWSKIKEEVGCSDLWARDLRRTFATIGLSHGIGQGVIGELLNHKSTETTKIYAKLMKEMRINAVDQIATRIEAIKTKEERV